MNRPSTSGTDASNFSASGSDIGPEKSPRRAEPAPSRRPVVRRGGVSPDRQLWIDMLAHLRRAHPAICRQWFEELEALGVAGGTLNLRAQSAIHRDYLKRTCAEAFNDALRTVSGRLLSIRFVGPEDDWSDAPVFGPNGSAAVETLAAHAAEPVSESSAELPVIESPLREPSDPMHRVEVKPVAPVGVPAPSRVVEHRRRADEGLAINPDYDFGNFVVGPGNRLAHAAAVAVGESQGRQYNPLFIHGGVGLGKTHLLQAACLRILERTPHARVYYTSCEGFMTQFMESVQSGQMSEFRHRYRDIDVLVVDDIHFLAKRDRTQEEFFHTFNNLYQAGKQILLSSDAAPEEIPDLEDRLVSRFKWGLVAKIDPPCYETRVAILKTKAKVRGLEFPDDCACFIAARIDSNIRELEGAITRVQILASVENKPIDLALVKSALGELNDEMPPEPSIQQIITAVTDYYRIRLSDLQSKRRPRSVTIPRQVCMFLARRMTNLSLEEIGGYFGGRDHTTVMHAVKTIDQRKDTDQDFVGQLRAIEERIRASG